MKNLAFLDDFPRFPVAPLFLPGPDSLGGAPGSSWERKVLGGRFVAWVLHVNNLNAASKSKKKHLESGAIQQDHLFNRCWTRPHKWQQGYDDPNMMSVMDGIWANSSGFTKLKSLAVWGWLADILTSIDGAWSACEAVILESWQNFGMIFMTDSMIYGQNMLKSPWFMVKLEKIPCFHKTRLRLWTDRFELHHRWFGLASPTFSIIFPCHPILKCKPWLNLSLLV